MVFFVLVAPSIKFQVHELPAKCELSDPMRRYFAKARLIVARVVLTMRRINGVQSGSGG